MNIQKMDSP